METMRAEYQYLMERMINIKSKMTWTMFLENRGIAFYPFASFILEYTWLRNEAFGIFATLLILDTIAWIIKSMVLWQKITSDKLWKWVASKIILVLVPVVLWLSAKLAWVQDAGAEALILSWVSLLWLAQAYSFIQKAYIIITGKKVTEHDAVSQIIEWILQVIKNLLSKLTDDKNW